MLDRLLGSGRRRNVAEIVLRVLFDEFDERLEASVAVEVEEGLRAGRLELECRETADLEVDGRREVILGRVHFRADER